MKRLFDFAEWPFSFLKIFFMDLDLLPTPFVFSYRITIFRY